MAAPAPSTPPKPDFSRIIDAATVSDTPVGKAEALLLALAARIKATSNDQNVQKLARELVAAAPEIAAALQAGARV